MTDKEKKREQVRGRIWEKEADDVVRIEDPEGRVPTPEELAKAICLAADKKVGIKRGIQPK